MPAIKSSKEKTMVDALIIDACRTPRGIGKAGKGSRRAFIRSGWAQPCCGRWPIAPGSAMSTTSSGAAVRNVARRAAISAGCRRSTMSMEGAGGMAPAIITERV
jgi:hypothetical protein